MKRIVKAVTSIILLACIACTLAVSAFAWEKPIGSGDTSGVPELTASTSNPDMTKVISWGLTSSEIVTEKALLATNYRSEENPEFTLAQLAEIGNQFKYGFSLIGAKRIGRPIGALVDQYFATGAAGANLASGMSRYGAFTATMDENTYNVKGESVPDSTSPMTAGYAYKFLFTFNFGKIANIESFGFVNTWKQGVPQAADIYVSDNGTDWTLVGYYDRNQLRLDGEDYTYQDAKILGEDAKENIYGDDPSKNCLLRFDLPKNTKGQFLRIGVTACNASSGTFLEYGKNLVAIGEENAIREMFVWGSLTEQVGYTYQEGDGDYVDPNPGEHSEEVTTDDSSEVIIKKEDKKPKNNTETSANAEVPGTSEAPSEEKGGCKSSAGIISLPILMLGGAAVALKRRRKD